MRAAVVQFNAGADKADNVRRAAALVERALKQRCRFAALPEVFNWRGDTRDAGAMALAAERVPGPSLLPFFDLARRYRAHILAGSVLEQTREKHYYNTSVLIGPSGGITAKYRKINLFDAALGAKIICESDYMKAGRQPVLGKAGAFTAGLSICYDLRFPEMFQRYAAQGAQVLLVPSCFTKRTGQAHWEPLLRARAIENLSYVLAPNQAGTSPRGVEAYGNSMIISPWGEILARASAGKEEIIYADIDLIDVAKARKTLPGIIK